MARGFSSYIGSDLIEWEFINDQVKGFGWEEFGAELDGALLKEIKRHGKHLIVTFDSNCDRSLDMVISPRMTGTLSVTQSPDTHIRARFRFNNRPEVVYRDPRMFGKIHLATNWLEMPHLRALGRDLLSQDCDLFYFLAVLNQAIDRHRRPYSIKEFLLEQTYIAGIGNYMASEILYTANLRPTRLITDLTLLDCQRVLTYAKALASLMVASDGVSLNDYVTFDGIPGRGQDHLRIYDKEVCSLGHPVIYSKIAARATYHCDTCQE